MTTKPLNQANPSLSHADNWFVHLARQINPRWWSYLLKLNDALLIGAAFICAYLIRYQLQWFRAVDPVFQTDFSTYYLSWIASVAILIFFFHLSGVYRPRLDRTWLEEIYAVAGAATIGVVVLITVHLVFRPLLYSRLIFLYTAILVVIFMAISRGILLLVRYYLRQHGVGVQRVVLIGAGDVGRMVMRNIAARPGLGYQLIGFLDDNPAKGTTNIGRFRALGAVENFPQVLQSEEVDVVIICLPWQSHRTVSRLINECEQAQVKAQIVPDLFQLTKNQMRVDDLNGIPLISSREVSIAGGNLILKRGSDLLLAALITLFAFPLGLLIALAVRLDSPGPILYTQVRVGRHGEHFRMYKFRSMVADAEERREEVADLNEASGPLFKIKDDPRRTRVGRWLRRWSLDELPQLINIFRGEMSLVGPRPNLPAEVTQYREWHKKRLSVSPGITGLWQVSGRSDLTFDEMVLLDIYYAENWSLGMDFNILLQTIPKVLMGKGAY
jgi:exopolysaccharide biosynthesis polyprenyl glycosylphosphotransferase